MTFFHQFMLLYQQLFHPAVVLGGAAVLVAYEDWKEQNQSWQSFTGRLGTLFGIVGISLLPVALVVFKTEQTIRSVRLTRIWYIDPLVAMAVTSGSALTWFIWRIRDWGRKMTGGAIAIMAAAVPYGIISPFWNVSGHVSFTVLPTVYLTTIDRKYLPTMLIPAIMVVNRPLLDMHTWEESIAGIVLGLAGVLLARSMQRYHLRDADRSMTP